MLLFKSIVQYTKPVSFWVHHTLYVFCWSLECSRNSAVTYI